MDAKSLASRFDVDTILGDDLYPLCLLLRHHYGGVLQPAGQEKGKGSPLISALLGLFPRSFRVSKGRGPPQTLRPTLHPLLLTEWSAAVHAGSHTLQFLVADALVDCIDPGSWERLNIGFLPTDLPTELISSGRPACGAGRNLSGIAPLHPAQVRFLVSPTSICPPAGPGSPCVVLAAGPRSIVSFRQGCVIAGTGGSAR